MARPDPNSAAKPPSAKDGALVASSSRPAVAQPVPSAAVQPAVPANTQVLYQRLSTRQKFDVFLRYAHSPYAFAASAFDAGLAQANGDWYSYGGGMEGYGKRFGASLANNESGALFGRFLYPTLLHQDPRYLVEGKGGFKHRTAYALKRVLVTQNDSGKREFNTSGVLAAFTSAGLANTYYPREERSAGDTMVRGALSLLDQAWTNVLREFWPDIKRKAARRTPERIKKLEESATVARMQKVLNDGDVSPAEATCPVTLGRAPGTSSDPAPAGGYPTR